MTDVDQLLQQEWATMNGTAASAKGKLRRLMEAGASFEVLDDARRQWFRYATKATQAENDYLRKKIELDTT